MKTLKISQPGGSRWATAQAILLTVLASVAFAQTSSSGSSEPITPAQRQEKYRVAIANARTLAVTNNVEAAEQEIVAASQRPPNSAGWHMETAQRLLQVAEAVARAAKPAGTPALASRAVFHLTQAEQLSRDPRAKAAARSLIGFVQERYLADRAAALASHRAASQLAPKSARARETVERLERTDETLRARVPGGGR